MICRYIRLIVISALLLTSPLVYGQELLKDLENGSTVTLNEELRKNRVNTAQARGSLSGGTSGQVLSKSSDTNFDTAWTTPLPPTIFTTFGGNGKDGSKTISADANFSDHDGATAGVAQYTSLTIDATKILTIDTKYAYIAVSGDCHIHGTITAAGMMANGATDNVNTPGTMGGNGNGIATSNGAIYGSLGGSGGGGAGVTANPQYAGGAGGGAGTIGGAQTIAGAYPGNDGSSVASSLYATRVGQFLIMGSLGLNPFLEGGGGGGGGTRSTVGAVGGGSGGGWIYIEVAGELIFDGTITANGANGANGSSGQTFSGAGGGGGGVIIIRAKTLTSSGTITVAGGTGGAAGGVSGAAGGNGGAGYSAIVDI